MSSSEHDGTQNELAPCVPGATKAIRIPRHYGLSATPRSVALWRYVLTSSTDADSTIRRDYLEDDVEGSKNHRVPLKLTRLNDGDEENSKCNPPQIMAKLPSELLPDEVATVPICHLRRTGVGRERCKLTLQVTHQSLRPRQRLRRFLFLLLIFGIHT